MKYTKDDLEKMSDFEVNKSIAIALGGYGGAVGDWLPNGVKLKKDSFFYTEFDFNDWCSIMPLAVENNLTLQNVVGRGGNYWMAGPNTYHHYCDKSPQRAIACCLILVLQERE